MASVVTTLGKSIYNNRLKGTGTEPNYIAWGTGGGTAAVGDTTLFTESSQESRTAGTSSVVTTTTTNDTYQVVGTITVATSAKGITNVGLFDASTNGNLFLKSDFSVVNLTEGEGINFTLKAVLS
jgi:hypothetical protein